MQKYTKEERLLIGQRIYDGQLTVAQAAETYTINYYTARDYYRMYKASVNTEANGNNNTVPSSDARTAYSDMSREELLNELKSQKSQKHGQKKGTK